MKNRKHWANTGGAVTLPLAVAAGTVSGDLVALGTDGLYGHATTDAVTATMVTKGTNPQGLAAGQASVFLPGIVVTIGVSSTSLTAVANFGKVYLKPDKTYAATAAGNTFIGYKLDPTTIALRAN